MRLIDKDSLEPKPVMTEEVREAIMRLTMCAREECSLCKYEDSCAFDKQVEMATENMNTILTAFTERPKGKWIEVEKSEHERLSIVSMRCDQCGRYAYLVLPKGTKCVYDYCPWCGADMRGDKE